MTFEEKLERLSVINEEMADTKTSLEASLAMYKEAIELGADLTAYIIDKKETVEKLSKDANDILKKLESME